MNYRKVFAEITPIVSEGIMTTRHASRKIQIALIALAVLSGCTTWQLLALTRSSEYAAAQPEQTIETTSRPEKTTPTPQPHTSATSITQQTAAYSPTLRQSTPQSSVTQPTATTDVHAQEVAPSVAAKLLRPLRVETISLDGVEITCEVLPQTQSFITRVRVWSVSATGSGLEPGVVRFVYETEGMAITTSPEMSLNVTDPASFNLVRPIENQFRANIRFPHGAARVRVKVIAPNEIYSQWFEVPASGQGC